MLSASWIIFFATSVASGAFFLFKARRFDLLSVAYIGALFYFSPLFFDRTLQSSPEFPSTIPQPVYLIATAYIVGLVIAAAGQSSNQPPNAFRTSHPSLSGWYLSLSAAAFLAAVIQSHGSVFNSDKVQSLQHVGIFYVFFEVAAGLAVISGTVERRWKFVAAGVFMLALDLFVGFRVYVVLTALSVALVLLIPEGKIRLSKKILTYGLAATLLFAAMLLTHSIRYAIFNRLAVLSGEPTPKIVTSGQLRSDTIQFGLAPIVAPATQPNSAEAAPSSVEAASGTATAAPPVSAPTEGSILRKWAAIPFKLFVESEPFIIQATLSAVVYRNMSCSSTNILKSAYLLIPPGLTRFVPNSFPSTFYDEYQPQLYPDITYGTGGNIWAEMLCRFGYFGVFTFGLLLIASLVQMSRLLSRSSSITAPPLALGAVLLAFYTSRNDLHFTLVMLRQIFFVFLIVWLVATAVRRLRTRHKPA